MKPTVPPEAALPVAALVTVTGGFLDAFTYVGHGRVFANSMTGNIVLLGAFGATGNWTQALRHVPPLVAFLLGLAVAHLLARPRFLHWVRHPAIASLKLEALFLLAAAWLPPQFPDLPLVLGISFVAAMQWSSFPKVGEFAYASVMTTGNLRRMADGFLLAANPQTRAEGLRQGGTFALVCLSFLVGAALGGFFTTDLGNRALLVPAALLAMALIAIKRGSTPVGTDRL